MQSNEDCDVTKWIANLNDQDLKFCENLAHESLEGLKGRNSRYGSYEQMFHKRLLSFMGQLCAARVLDVSVITDFKNRRSDLEFGINVRTTTFYKPQLYLNNHDIIGRAYILVRMNGTFGECMGWLRFNEEAKRYGEFQFKPSNTGKPTEVWSFPAIKLNPMISMVTGIHKIRSTMSL